MQHQSFKVEFFWDQNFEDQNKHAGHHRYSAVITLISKNFNLFKVTDIQRIEKADVIELAGNYVVTSYSLQNNEVSKWKDALTFQSGRFFEMVGGAIDKCIESASSTFKYN